MKSLLRLPALVLVAALCGCAGTWSTIEQGSMGHYSNTSDAYIVVRDANSWSFLCAWTHASGPVPAVNFNSDMVLGTFLGVRPTSGYSVAVTNVTWDAQYTTATVKETGPAEGQIVLYVLTKPFAFTRLTKHDGTVTITKGFGPDYLGVEKDYPALGTEDFLLRKAANGGVWPGTPAEMLAKLNQHKCPLDNTPLASAAMPADGSYTDLASTMWFCPKDAVYWWGSGFVPGAY